MFQNYWYKMSFLTSSVKVILGFINLKFSSKYFRLLKYLVYKSVSLIYVALNLLITYR